MAATICRLLSACCDKPAGAGGSDGAIVRVTAFLNVVPAVVNNVLFPRVPLKRPNAKPFDSSSVYVWQKKNNKKRD